MKGNEAAEKKIYSNSCSIQHSGSSRPGPTSSHLMFWKDLYHIEEQAGACNQSSWKPEEHIYHTALLLHAPHGGSKLEELCRSKHHHLWVAMPSQTHQISTALNRIISGLCYVFERILGLKTTNRPQELWGLLPPQIQFSTICTFDTYLWNRGQAYFKNKYEI